MYSLVQLSLLAASALAHSPHAGCYDEGDGRFNQRIDNYIARQNEGLELLHKRSQANTYYPETSNATMRDLQWGDLNIIHVTDTHGWLSGHLNDQDEYSADWGDYVSFTEHMQNEADRRGVDLLFVETGDRHDGTGLSDSTKVDGLVSNGIFAQTPFDIVSIGNHELYKNEDIEDEYNKLRPTYGDHYLGSNVDIWNAANKSWIDAGKHYRVFTTNHNKLNVLAFSFLYDFKGNANHSRVTEVEKAAKEDWFKKALKEEKYDIILLTGHIPVRGFKEYDAAVKAIRELNPNVPIQGLGGHTHLRDFRVFDSNAVALESGRYLETIGWASVTFKNKKNGTAINFTTADSNYTSTDQFTSKKQNQTNNSTALVEFNRRYIDFNPFNLAYHANRPIKNFTTPKGAAISQQIANMRKNLSLDTVYGKVEYDYQIDWAPFMSENSLFKLLTEHIHPLLKGNVSRESIPRIIITNTGKYRYPLLAGNFNKDQKYVVSPFSDAWLYAANVPVDVGEQVLDHLNNDYSYLKKRASSSNESSAAVLTYSPTGVIYPTLPAATATHQAEGREQSSLKLGYITHDDYGLDGDDTLHKPYKVYEIPNAIGTRQNIKNDSKTMDVIFTSFLQEDIEPFLKKHGWSGSIETYSTQYDRDMFEEYFRSTSSNSTSSK